VHVAESRDESDAELSAAVGEAVGHHFEYRAATKRRELRELLRRGRLSLVIGLAFAGGCVVAANAIGRAADDSVLLAILQESFVIGGWVAMWRPLEIFLYDWWPLRRRQLEYTRLSRMQTHVACAGA
jgi:hypothetical protein